MSDQRQQNVLSTIGLNGYVSADDVLTLRQQVFKDGVVDKAEIGQLLALAERAPDGDPAWTAFFGEAAGDYYLREEIPHDYITEREFLDLKLSVTQYGETVTPLVLSMLIKLMQDATATPPLMNDFVCDQIKRQLSERGRAASDNEPSITAQDVVIIRNFLFAAGGDGNAAVTQKEATLLFDLNDMTLSSGNDPSWSELFIKAISNHLMAHIGYTPPSREDALAQWEWVNDQSVNVGGFFNRMASGGMDAVRDLYARDKAKGAQASKGSAYDSILQSREHKIREAGKLTETEADWLADRIGRDGIVDDNELALLAYMRELEGELPEKLQSLLSRAA